MKVFKKLVVFVLVIAMVCGMVSGCKSSKEVDSKDNVGSVKAKSDAESSGGTEKQDKSLYSLKKSITTEKDGNEKVTYSKDKKHPYQEFDELPITIFNVGDEVYSKVNSIDVGNGVLQGGCWTNSEDDWFGLYNCYDSGFSDTLFGINLSDIKSVDCLDIINQQFETNVADKLLYYAEEYEFETIDKELLTVNGWEMCKYKGKAYEFKNGVKVAEFYLVTYIVLNEGYPTFFTIADESEAQGREKEIENIADMTAKTYRIPNEDWEDFEDLDD